MGELTGKTAVVTGGSRGIGRAVVERLCRDGAAVVFSYVSNADAAAQVEAAVGQAGGHAEAVRADVGSLADMRNLFEEAEARLGGLDVLVNNAGTGVVAAIADTTEEDFDRVMSVNAKGPFFAMQEAARRMRDGGRIVNISTINTATPSPETSVYAGSKMALEMFAQIGAQELAARGITVNIVSPGATDTELFHSANPPGAAQEAAEMTPMGRLGQPADVADVVAFLVGHDARWVTGQHIRASGGLL